LKNFAIVVLHEAVEVPYFRGVLDPLTLQKDVNAPRTFQKDVNASRALTAIGF
jgi:hypothetical protein